jgi:hypothetical protein
MLKNSKVGKGDFEADIEKLAVLVDILKWNYRARDHKDLATVNLFSILRSGTGKDSTAVGRTWGRMGSIVQQNNVVFELFEMVMTNVMSRMVQDDFGKSMEISDKPDTPA